MKRLLKPLEVNMQRSTVGLAKELSALILVDLLIAFLLLRWLFPFKGMLVYGDLGPLYGFSPINLVALLQLRLTAFEQLFSLLIGPILAQNVFFLALFFLPSIGILLILRETSEDFIVNLILSVSLGTILFPLIFSEFLGGGWEYFTWAFFVFISLKYLIRLAREQKTFTKNLYLSAIFYAISISASNFFPIGLYLSFPLILLMLFPKLDSVKQVKISIKRVGVFTLISALISIFTIFHDISFDRGYLSSQYAITQATNYVLGNMRFEFSVYSIPSGILGGVWGGPLFGFFTGDFFYILSLCAIFGGFLAFRFRSDHSWVLGRFLLIYLLYGSFIIALINRQVQEFYVSIKLLDDLEYPSFFLWAQAITLPLLIQNFVIVSARTLRGGVTKYDDEPHEGNFKAPDKRNYRNSQVWRRSFKKLKDILRSERSYKTAIIGIILLLLIANDLTYISHVSQDFTKAQGEPYIPQGLLSVHNWYVSEQQNISGLILVLPSYDNYYLDAAYAALPSNIVFNTVQNGAPKPGYNYSIYDNIYSLPLYNYSQAYAYDLSKLGIQYLILYKFPGSAEITAGGLTSSYNFLLNFLQSSNSFEEVYNASLFTIFKDKLFFVNVNQSFKIWGENLLNPSMYGSYLSSEVSQNNDVFNLTGPYSSSIRFTLVDFTMHHENGTMSQFSNGTLPITNPVANISYIFNVSILGVHNSTLCGSAYYYNTSSPSSFYSEFSVQTLFEYSQSTAKLESSELNIPTGIKLLRIILYAAGSKNETFWYVFENPGLYKITTPKNISSSPLFKNFMMSSLDQAKLLPSANNFYSGSLDFMHLTSEYNTIATCLVRT
ncbi:MAG: hypothetical protein QW292_10215 [Candidatus Parvarchaeota archaeon]